MDDPEFNRIVEEGMAALTKARERLKKQPDKPPDWEEITPVPLKSAIKHIRRQFEKAEWQFAMQIECGCYLSLHPELVTKPTFKGGQNLIPEENRLAWQAHYQGMKESECFAYWTNQFSELLEKNIVPPFDAFLRIGLAQESRLDLPPVEWAKTLVRGLLYSLEWTVPHLIKRMCDEQEHRLEINTANFDAHCAWVSWRAPRFVHMHPSGNTLYDATTAWQRVEDADTTELLLRGLTGKMSDPARFELDRLAGEAYVALACTPPATHSQAEERSPASPKERSAGDNSRKMSDPTRGAENRLPAKQTDLSRYLEETELTDRQRECFSLKFEYGLTVTAIAERLQIARATVDEHIDAAERRLQLSSLKEKAKERRSRFNQAE
jgi:DNA-binding CsgD family transcriptional regulator